MLCRYPESKKYLCPAAEAYNKDSMTALEIADFVFVLAFPVGVFAAFGFWAFLKAFKPSFGTLTINIRVVDQGTEGEPDRTIPDIILPVKTEVRPEA